jgi:deoxyribonuclease-4
MPIKFGPAGLGGVNEAVENLENFSKSGLKACEIAFTYGVYIKSKSDAERIKKKAKELGIFLSIHAPYWINLNSAEPEKVKASKQRIINCLKIGTWLGAKKIVFHPGYYGKLPREQTYEKIKNEIIDLQKIRKQNNYTPELAPETTGKTNVFGSIEEISNLVNDTKCSFCIDFAHILAREKNYSFDKIKKHFNRHKNWHIHFSGIESGAKGEKRHLMTKDSELKQLLLNLPKDKDITIINESPDPFNDSVKGLELSKTITH